MEYLICIYQVLSTICLLFIVPYLIGKEVNALFKIEKSLTRNYLFGNIFIWALFQLITVPLILMKQSFLIVVVIVTIICFSICIYSIKKRGFPNCKTFLIRGKNNPFFILMFVIISILLLCIIFLQHTDADDSRFVVNAVNIVHTNRMFLTDCITGLEMEIWQGELVKDVTSPWAVYIAYYAKLTNIPAVIMAHSILPISLLFCALCVFWLLSEVFFRENITDRSIFMSILILVNIYGHFSIYSSECFLLTRLWQGKATVAGVAIPAVFLICLNIYEKEKKVGYYILLLMLDIGMCLMSGMGIIIGAIIIGVIGLVYGIVKKNWKINIILWAICIPNIVYYFLYITNKA